MRRHRSPGTPAASDPSDSSTNSGSSPIAISLGSYMDKAAGRRACTGKKFTQDVSVVSRSCLGLVSVVSWSCLGLVLVMSRCCFGDVMVMSRSCLGLVSVFFW